MKCRPANTVDNDIEMSSYYSVVLSQYTGVTDGLDRWNVCIKTALCKFKKMQCLIIMIIAYNFSIHAKILYQI